MTENKELVKELEQDETALTFTAGVTLATTGVMIADLSLKASHIAAGVPDAGVLYLGGILLIGSGAMTLSYVARQHTMMKIKNALKQAEITPLPASAREEVPVTA